MELKQAVVALAALAQETRLSAFRALVAAGEAGLPAGEIAARVGVASTTLSFHLKELTYAGLVTSRSEGRFVIYCADFRAMRALLDYLSEECCGGRPELCLSNPPTGGPSR
ncbi:MAG: metalloregulator ArsR/SmtB family transcription factor [Chromatiaceae bacterium]|jgi:ArsR family transcriptional regulator, arsenate/arsenite/antimonite-responsive transcriptional repressor